MRIVRTARRLHYLAEGDDDVPTEVPVDPWAQPYPEQNAFPEQAYVPETRLPVVQPVEPYDVAPLPNPGSSGPMGYLEGLVEYALPALALYIVLDEDASFFVRAAAAYAAYDWLTKSPVSPLNTRGGIEFPESMSAYRRLRGYSKPPCGCEG